MIAQIYPLDDGDWGVRLIGQNNEVILAWGGYAAEFDARMSFERLMEEIGQGVTIQTYQRSLTEGPVNLDGA